LTDRRRRRRRRESDLSPLWIDGCIWMDWIIGSAGMARIYG